MYTKQNEREPAVNSNNFEIHKSLSDAEEENEICREFINVSRWSSLRKMDRDKQFI